MYIQTMWMRSRLCAGLLAIGSAAIDAQNPKPDTLPTVPITVLRTPFDLSRAPFSITRVSRRDATVARPGFALDEVLGRLPGIQVDNRLNFALGERISIRGFGSRAQFGVRGIRVVVDDIPATLADGQTTLNNVDLGSLGDAQVLRGPASSLYGNAAGGVILLESAPAPAQRFQPDVRIMAGSYGLRRFQLGAGGTQGDLGYVLTGNKLDYDGFRSYSVARNTHLNGVMTYEKARTQSKFVINGEHHNAQNPGSLSDSLLAIDRRQAFANNVAQRTGEKGSQLQTGLSTRIHLPSGELRLSAYALHRTLSNPIPPRIIALGRNAGGVRAAYAVSFGEETKRLTTIVGAESNLQRDDRQNYINEQGDRGDIVLDQDERVTNLAPFAQGVVHLGRWQLLGGVRYDWLRFAADDHLITTDNPDDSGVRVMSAFSPSLGIAYMVAANTTLYANASTAFQSPTTTELANRPNDAGGLNPALEPERMQSGEIGVRGSAGERIAYQAAAYYIRVRDALIPFELASFPGRQFYRNVGKATHRGFEMDVSAPLTSFMAARASYAYTHARFVTDTMAESSNNGFLLPGIAPHVFTFSIDAGTMNGRMLSAEVRSQSSMAVNDANTAYSPSYVVANVRGTHPLGANVSLFGGIGNLFNKRYNTSVVINAAGGRYFEPAAGRNGYLGVQWNR